MTDRDANGRYVVGHKSNGRRPPKEREEKYRYIMMTTITFEKFEVIVSKLADKAARGNYQCAKLLFDYLLGPPTQKVDLDTGERLTSLLERYRAVEQKIYGANGSSNGGEGEGSS